MSPEQFLAKLAKNGPEPAYLFLGPEAFERTRCRRALLDAVLPSEQRENGFTRHDLDRTPLAAALDDARALSLFASRRVIWLAAAEAAVGLAIIISVYRTRETLNVDQVDLLKL